MDIFVLNQSFRSVLWYFVSSHKKFKWFLTDFIYLLGFGCGNNCSQSQVIFFVVLLAAALLPLLVCCTTPWGSTDSRIPFSFCDSVLRAEYWRRISAGVNKNDPGDVAALQYHLDCKG